MTNVTMSAGAGVPLTDAMRQRLRPKLLARGVPQEMVDRWLAEAPHVGELTERLIAWCRQTSEET